VGAGSQTLSLLSDTFRYIRLTDLARVPEAGVCCDDQWTCVHVCMCACVSEERSPYILIVRILKLRV
jgi:hypothetical protein